ncbi:pyridoxamine 5'-phosphate oxidase family protein [Cellulomonas sp. PhB143]|uniref:pyridoxamine 5'-phosphate oxidase family protein n=1 Tax=Cellulomonas sp. PhB143 TaxID=2485186 RepID=UPI000FBD9F17|nr:pyridoxamine 5'-phosphate oxidase family protein [Cellulomonas sp. PhB143]ROS75293.1 general stress protein 26 [Cellulomonas sp. PhB143]
MSAEATDAQRETVRSIVGDARIAMLTTLDADGALVSRPMGVQATEEDADLWFFADAHAHTAGEVAHDARANAAFSTSSSWLSVSGRLAVVRDLDAIREHWGPSAEAWFPDGPETPGVVLLRLHAETAEYWDAPGGRLVTAVSLVRAKVTGKRFEGGENETVGL